jgi:hypothetical protein
LIGDALAAERLPSSETGPLARLQDPALHVATSSRDLSVVTRPPVYEDPVSVPSPARPHRRVIEASVHRRFGTTEEPLTTHSVVMACTFAILCISSDSSCRESVPLIRLLDPMLAIARTPSPLIESLPREAV